MVIALPTSGNKTEAKTDEKTEIYLKKQEEETALYHTEMEQKLAQLLSGVEGVGKARVILMMEEKKDGFYHTQDEHVEGVLISAQGADDPFVSQEIVQAVMALFQVEPHKIKVMKMK